MSNEMLPQYSNPPVIETVMSAQFLPINGFGNAQLGAFWSRLGADVWPHVDNVTPLPLLNEKFGEEIGWTVPQFQLKIAPPNEVPSLRLMIRNANKSRLIQVQNGRLILNWTGDGGEPYPRYQTLRKEFSELLDKFTSFLKDLSLPAPAFDQWEVTYVNKISRGSVWEENGDATFFKPLKSLPFAVQGGRLEDVSAMLAYVLPNESGRLHMSINRLKDQAANEVFVLEFVARGPLAVEETSLKERLLSGVDLGRSTIVRSFRELMSDEANRHWGLSDV